MALKELTPSVSEQEMAHYREVQAKFSAPKKEEREEETVDEEQLSAAVKAASWNGAKGSAAGKADLKQLLAVRDKAADDDNEGEDEGNKTLLKLDEGPKVKVKPELISSVRIAFKSVGSITSVQPRPCVILSEACALPLS